MAPVRKGFVQVKEDGLVSWLWNRKWLVLRDQSLTFHKNEVSLGSASLFFLSSLYAAGWGGVDLSNADLIFFRP